MKHNPPQPNHVPGTNRGEELTQKKGKEPGREEDQRQYRSSRDSTSINAKHHAPISPAMPSIPPA